MKKRKLNYSWGKKSRDPFFGPLNEGIELALLWNPVLRYIVPITCAQFIQNLCMALGFNCSEFVHGTEMIVN